jgi:GNAT superfamily N-acetyltransferase
VTTAIRRYAPQDRDVVVELSLRAWEPVHESMRQVMGDEIFDLHHQPVWRTRQRKDVEAVLDDDEAAVWVAERDGAVIGWVAAILHRDERMGEVHMVAVEPDHQGHGIGTELTDVATDWMREAGMTHAVILTGGDAGHAPARRTYEKAGYRPFPGVNYFKAL